MKLFSSLIKTQEPAKVKLALNQILNKAFKRQSLTPSEGWDGLDGYALDFPFLTQAILQGKARAKPLDVENRISLSTFFAFFLSLQQKLEAVSGKNNFEQALNNLEQALLKAVENDDRLREMLSQLLPLDFFSADKDPRELFTLFVPFYLTKDMAKSIWVKMTACPKVKHSGKQRTLSLDLHLSFIEAVNVENIFNQPELVSDEYPIIKGNFIMDYVQDCTQLNTTVADLLRAFEDLFADLVNVELPYYTQAPKKLTVNSTYMKAKNSFSKQCQAQLLRLCDTVK